MKSSHFRKNNRLETYNYAQAGIYFITICTVNKECVLGTAQIVEDCAKISLSSAGIVVADSIRAMGTEFMTIDDFVVMPNHIHILIILNRAGHHISEIVRYLKSQVKRTLGRNVFQMGFHDHVIRDETDYLNHREYIANNPVRWALDEYHIT
ncbi:MAG: hypothetical protein LBS17_04450 [Actinomycetes bacterium]|jgi:REP element-mobilizing transposase RayT|nr:hypothetical protein [Actinomycetes bacterium]